MSRPTPRVLASAGVALALGVAGFGMRTAFAASPSAASSVVTVDPARILDTRAGLGATGPLQAGQTISVQVTGVGGVPADATGVVVNLTATQASDASFVAAWPSGQPQPSTSVLNFTAGEDIANTVTMAIGAGGKIDLFNSAGSVQLLADVTGYLVPAESGGGGGGPVGPTNHSLEVTAYGAMSNGFGGQYGDYGCIRVGGNANQTGDVELDLDLPHGAVITSIDFRYFDNDLANFQMGLSGSSGGFPGVPGPIGLVDNQTQSTGAVGYLTASVTPTGVQPVSSTVRYWFVAVSPGVQLAGNAHRFCGATVNYTLP